MLRWCATTCKEGVASLPVGSSRGREWPLRWRADPVAILWEKSQWFQLYNNIYSNSYSNKSESTWENSGFEIFSSMAACCFMESCGLKFHFNRGGKFAGRQICREWCASEPLDWFLGWPFLPFLHFLQNVLEAFLLMLLKKFLWLLCGGTHSTHSKHTMKLAEEWWSSMVPAWTHLLRTRRTQLQNSTTRWSTAITAGCFLSRLQENREPKKVVIVTEATEPSKDEKPRCLNVEVGFVTGLFKIDYQLISDLRFCYRFLLLYILHCGISSKL